MEQSESKFNNTFKSVLDSASSGMVFESLWTIHSNKDKVRFKYKRTVLIPFVAVFTLFLCITIGYTYSRIADNTDYSFIDDPAIVGNWEAVDFVKEIEEFNPEKPYFETELYLNNLVFIKDGRMLDRIDNTNLAGSSSRWTKGVIINEAMKTASKYVIKDIDGSSYMFMEWKSGDYTHWGMKPGYYVLKKIDSEDYSNYQVTRVEDNIEYPFVDNPEMLGKWKSVDIVNNVKDFNPEKLSWKGTLYVKEINIIEDGRLTMEFSSNHNSTNLSWTEDVIIDHNKATASKCIIKEIDGKTYMFYEWKSGDYTLRGMQSNYYVLKKIK